MGQKAPKVGQSTLSRVDYIITGEERAYLGALLMLLGWPAWLLTRSEDTSTSSLGRKPNRLDLEKVADSGLYLGLSSCPALLTYVPRIRPLA
jgi:hypothetical protein